MSKRGLEIPKRTYDKIVRMLENTDFTHSKIASATGVSVNQVNSVARGERPRWEEKVPDEPKWMRDQREKSEKQYKRWKERMR
jgi:hypothetical protein